MEAKTLVLGFIVLTIALTMIYIPEMIAVADYENYPNCRGFLKAPPLPTFAVDGYERKEVFFNCSGEKCRGRFYHQQQISNKIKKLPTIIFTMGIPFILEIGTDEVIRYQAKTTGFNVFAYDIRTFGGSEGSPRQLIHIDMQVQDLRSAIEYVSTLESVDEHQVLFLSPSFGSAIQLLYIAKYANSEKAMLPKYIVSLFPMIGSIPEIDSFFELALERWRDAIPGLYVAAIDRLRKYLGMKRLYFAFISERKENIMSIDYLDDKNETWAERLEVMPSEMSYTYKNLFVAESLLNILGFSAVEALHKIPNDIGILFVAGKQDTISPLYKIEYAMNILSSHRIELFVVNCKHNYFLCPESGRIAQKVAQNFLQAL